MSVTHIEQPNIQTAQYFFDTEDEAHMFVAGVREDLAEQEFFDYVGSDVIPFEFHWKASVDYIDRTPPAPKAA